jgi:hypothetical protein
MTSPDPVPDQKQIQARQRDRARVMALLLGAFVVLMFAITIAKMAINR